MIRRIVLPISVPIYLLCLITIVAVHTGNAQTDCGIVDSIQYPIDTETFILTQDYAAPSPRHQGRFHTGEDWYGGRDTSLGQPVFAAARGRVTYSWHLGWGRDGAVVIIEHRFPNGSIFYTQYGHLSQTDEIQLPTVGDCVERGDAIAIVGDVRPAPHVHFEVRTNNPDFPGPGYTWDDPLMLGWLDPSEFIAEMQRQFGTPIRRQQ